VTILSFGTPIIGKCQISAQQKRQSVSEVGHDWRVYCRRILQHKSYVGQKRKEMIAVSRAGSELICQTAQPHSQSRQRGNS